MAISSPLVAATSAEQLRTRVTNGAADPVVSNADALMANGSSPIIDVASPGKKGEQWKTSSRGRGNGRGGQGARRSSQ